MQYVQDPEYLKERLSEGESPYYVFKENEFRFFIRDRLIDVFKR